MVKIEQMGGRALTDYDELRPPTWLEEMFDDPGSEADPVRVLTVTIVDLNDTRVTDADLEYIKGLTKLRDLDLSDMYVTDAGLEHLIALKSLESLALWGTNVTDEGVRKLQQALSNCKIWR